MQHGNPSPALVAAIAAVLSSGDDRLIEDAFAQAPSAGVLRALTSALDLALHGPGNSALQLRLFAVPVLFVAGGRAASVIPGVLPDVAAVHSLFEAHGTLGPLKNFALSATLSSVAGVAALKPGQIYRILRESGTDNYSPLDLPPAEIRMDHAHEAVHLRFLTGVCVTGPDAPAFPENVGDIGAWGLPFTRALASQLAQPGVTLLPIPRVPMSLHKAVSTGRFARNELRFQLFLTSALRKFRSSIGEAMAVVEARADGSIHTRLSSPFDSSMAPEHAWPLQPCDDLGVVASSIFSLLDECRVSDVQVADTVQPVPASH